MKKTLNIIGFAGLTLATAWGMLTDALPGSCLLPLGVLALATRGGLGLADICLESIESI